MRDLKELRGKPARKYSKKINTNYYRSLNVREFHAFSKKKPQAVPTVLL
tara:strand:- start:453 stop:599 length:147 start_codon:yes stop_codon:yes gene_type:complete